MPAFVRTIKAQSVAPGDFFEFNKSIEYKGEKLGLLEIKYKKSGIYRIKVYQDLNNDQKMTKSDLIFKGEIYGGVCPPNEICLLAVDHITNFTGTVKLSKQMHSCEWDMQKEEKKRDKDMVACTRDFVPTVYELMLKHSSTGRKIYPLPVGKFANEDCYSVLDDGNPDILC